MSSFTVPHDDPLTTDDLRRILLIRLSSLGDILLMTPLLNLLRTACPQARVDVLVKVEFRDLLRAHPGITRLLTFDSGRSLLGTLRSLRADHYDLALDLHGTPRSQLILRGLRARRKLAYSKRVLRRALLVRLGWNTLAAYDTGARTLRGTPAASGPDGPFGSRRQCTSTPKALQAMQAHIARSLPDASRISRCWP